YRIGIRHLAGVPTPNGGTVRTLSGAQNGCTAPILYAVPHHCSRYTLVLSVVSVTWETVDPSGGSPSEEDEFAGEFVGMMVGILVRWKAITSAIAQEITTTSKPNPSAGRCTVDTPVRANMTTRSADILRAYPPSAMRINISGDRFAAIR